MLQQESSRRTNLFWYSFAFCVQLTIAKQISSEGSAGLLAIPATLASVLSRVVESAVVGQPCFDITVEVYI